MKRVCFVLLPVLLSIAAVVPARADGEDDGVGSVAVASSTSTLLTTINGAAVTSGPLMTLATATLTADPGKKRALLATFSAQTMIQAFDVQLTPALAFQSATIAISVYVDGVLMTPGFVVLDSTINALAQRSNASNFTIAIEQEGAAHAFTFYKVGLADTPGDKHVIEVKGQFLFFQQTQDNVVLDQLMAGVGSRTLVVTQGNVNTW